MADHDLTASTFAVRVAASTGASLAASVLAGLCALSGPRHGGATSALRQLIAEASRDGVENTLDHWLNRGAELPGFGHPLYPDGDLRAVVMLDGSVSLMPCSAWRKPFSQKRACVLTAILDLFRFPPDLHCLKVRHSASS